MKGEYLLNIERTHLMELSHNDQLGWIRNIGHNSMLEDWLTVRDPTTQAKDAALEYYVSKNAVQKKILLS